MEKDLERYDKDQLQSACLASRPTGKYLERYSKAQLVILDVASALREDGFSFGDPKTKAAICAAYEKLDLDPDGCSVRLRCGIACTSDGLVSLRRLCDHEETAARVVEGYRRLRRAPLLWWPQEQQGINQSRCRLFGDRPEAALHDLHRHLLDLPCGMEKVYRLPKTSQWLASFKPKEAVSGMPEGEAQWRGLVDWMGIKGFLVDDDYRVYDLAAGDGSVIDVAMGEYPAEWSQYAWSEEYYQNVCSVVAKRLQQLDSAALA